MNLDDLISMCNDQSPQTPGDGDPELLARNLRALALRSPSEARLIESSPGRMDIAFIESEEGLSATLDGVALGSKRRPVSEARKLVGSVDAESAAIGGVLGFGLGYHCSELLAHLGKTSVVVCFEPDAALLRSVLSRIDCTELF